MGSGSIVRWNMTGQTSQSGDRQSLSLITDREARIAKLRTCNLLSDAFMSVVMEDKLACQHVLRVLTGNTDLIVTEVRSQYRISKLHSHDAILDILAEDDRGELYHVELQRRKTMNHPKRIRFYAAMVDSEYLMKGKTYTDLPDLHIIYIGDWDLWQAGYTAYPVQRQFGNAELPYDDGQQILYVNTAIDDGTKIAVLMKYFKTADPDDMSQGALSKRVRFLKCEKGGYDIMCKVSDEIYQEGRKAERKKWQGIVARKEAALADKEKVLADKEALIAKLQAQLAVLT